MTDQKTVVADHGTKPTSAPKAKRVSDEKRFISDERRVQDALEDDEVRARCEPFTSTRLDLRRS